MSDRPWKPFPLTGKNFTGADAVTMNDIAPHDNPPALVDTFNRRLSYLRISITDQCNLNCVYCRPYARCPKIGHQEILRYEEILRIVRVGADLGISKIRITGGEPLVRKGVYAFLKQITAIKGLKDVSLTTNGVLLKEHLQDIQAAGISRLNISLDSLHAEKICAITGHDVFHRIWQGIQEAHRTGFSPIKLNMVPIRGINDDEVSDFARLSLDHPFHIRFIEYMPIGNTGIEGNRRLLAEEIKQRIESVGPLLPVTPVNASDTARRYRFENAKGEIGLIQPISSHFCSTCNRLRLTADGQLRLCLLSNRQMDLKTPLRKGCSDEDLRELLLEAARRKPMEHNFRASCEDTLGNHMSAIGG